MKANNFTYAQLIENLSLAQRITNEFMRDLAQLAPMPLDSKTLTDWVGTTTTLAFLKFEKYGKEYRGTVFIPSKNYESPTYILNTNRYGFELELSRVLAE